VYAQPFAPSPESERVAEQRDEASFASEFAPAETLVFMDEHLQLALEEVCR
jgi:hypothetical protein